MHVVQWKAAVFNYDIIPLLLRSRNATCLNMYSIEQELLLKSLLTVVVITKYPFSQSQVLTVAFIRSNFPVIPLDGRILNCSK